MLPTNFDREEEGWWTVKINSVATSRVDPVLYSQQNIPMYLIYCYTNRILFYQFSNSKSIPIWNKGTLSCGTGRFSQETLAPETRQRIQRKEEEPKQMRDLARNPSTWLKMRLSIHHYRLS